MVKYVGQQTVTPMDFGNGAVYWTHFSTAGGTEQSLIWVNGGEVGKCVGSSERKSGQRQTCPATGRGTPPAVSLTQCLPLSDHLLVLVSPAYKALAVHPYD